MRIMTKAAKWKDAADRDSNLYATFQAESAAAVLGGKTSDAWKNWMRRFISNDLQLQRLLGNDNLDPDYKDEILAYMGSGGVCTGGTSMNLILGMPDSYQELLDNVAFDTRNDGSNPIPLPTEP